MAIARCTAPVLIVLTLLMGACGDDGADEVTGDVTDPDVIVTADLPDGTTAETAGRTARLIEERVEAASGNRADVALDENRVTIRADGQREVIVAAVGVVGELRFRPVLEVVPPKEQLALTPPDDDKPDIEVLLAERDDAARYRLAPSQLRGDVLEAAHAVVDDQMGQGWIVNLVFTTDGIEAFNRVARICYDGGPGCPTRQLAIVVDSEVISAPTVQAPQFERDAQISGNFTEAEAKGLAAALGTGPLPVEVDVTNVGG